MPCLLIPRCASGSFAVAAPYVQANGNGTAIQGTTRPGQDLPTCTAILTDNDSVDSEANVSVE